MGETPRVRVRLHRYRGRPFGLIWECGPRRGEVSSGETRERDALRAAGRLEEQLLAGLLPTSQESIRITWAEFRQRYEREWLAGLSFGSQRGWATAVAHFERIAKPRLLADITKATLSNFRGELEAMDISPASARSYYRAIRAGLGWAESVDLIDRVPTIRQRKQAQQSAAMRSRPITAEEFERMLLAVPKVRGDDAKAFAEFISGLWLSGLRISELNRLSWDARATVHLELGDLPLIAFLGGQKNRRDNYLPAPPEFWQLVTRRGRSRTGLVFPIVTQRTRKQMTTLTIGRRIADIGRAAGVIVNDQTGKSATAHDLRRAYLTRVAAKATMSQTQAIARHADPKTTSEYYVRHEAEQLAKSLGW